MVINAKAQVSSCTDIKKLVATISIPYSPTEQCYSAELMRLPRRGCVLMPYSHMYSHLYLLQYINRLQYVGTALVPVPEETGFPSCTKKAWA